MDIKPPHLQEPATGNARPSHQESFQDDQANLGFCSSRVHRFVGRFLKSENSGVSATVRSNRGTTPNGSTVCTVCLKTRKRNSIKKAPVAAQPAHESVGDSFPIPAYNQHQGNRHALVEDSGSNTRRHKANGEPVRDDAGSQPVPAIEDRIHPIRSIHGGWVHSGADITAKPQTTVHQQASYDIEESRRSPTSVEPSKHSLSPSRYHSTSQSAHPSKRSISHFSFPHELHDDAKRPSKPELAIREEQSPFFCCLPRGSVKLSDKIGQGGHGEVHRGTLGSVAVAVKKIRMESKQASEEFGPMLRKEYVLLERLRCKFVIEVIGYFQDEEDLSFSIVMALAENGDLKDFLRKRSLRGDWLRKAQICAKIAEGVNFLHKKGVVHGDLKARNILLDSSLNPKIADFGISRTFTSIGMRKDKWPNGTPDYVAPERFNQAKYNHEEGVLADIYGYGLIMWEVVTDGEDPYGTMGDKDILISKLKASIINPDADPLEDIGRLNDDVPQILVDLVSQCVSKPSLRPSLISVQNTLSKYIPGGRDSETRGKTKNKVWMRLMPNGVVRAIFGSKRK